MPTMLDRAAYAAGQTARVGWYLAHYAAGRRQLKPLPKPGFPVGPFPDRQDLLRDMRLLFEREWDDIATGLTTETHTDPAAPTPRAFYRVVIP